MSISGSAVHKKIKEQIREVESQHSTLESDLYSVEQTLGNLTTEREGCYNSLAINYLPELVAEAIQSTLREVREDVEEIFGKKQERRKEIEKLMSENRAFNSKLESRVDGLTGQIEQKAKERDKTVKEIESSLSKIVNYTETDTEAKKAEARLQQNKQRIAEVEEEAKNKLPAFEGNKIFNYLLRAGYGTSQYEGNGLRKRLDSWVAEKVNFAKNKECYDFLKSMPELMKQEVARRQEELDSVVKKLQGIEAEEEKKYSLPEIVAQAKKLLEQRQELIAQDQQQDKLYAYLIQERQEMDSQKDPYHIKAVQTLKSFLKGEQITNLKARARQTKGTEDDNLVNRIEEIDAEIRQLKDKAKDVREQRDSLGTKLDDIRNIENRFRTKDYEGSYSHFSDGFDIVPLIAAYMVGRMSAGDINSKIDSSQHTSTPSYHSSYDYSSSSSSHSSSGGFGGGSFSSGGGISSGSFSSGHGF